MISQLLHRPWSHIWNSPELGPSCPLLDPLYANCSVRSREAFIFFESTSMEWICISVSCVLTCVRTSRMSWKFVVAEASFVCRSVTTFPRCSSAFSEPLAPFCALLNACKSDSCLLMAAMSCLIMYVSSLISTGRSSNSVLRRATERDSLSFL